MVTLKQTGVIGKIIPCPVKTPGHSPYTDVSRVPVPTGLLMSGAFDTLLDVRVDALMDCVANRLCP